MSLLFYMFIFLFIGIGVLLSVIVLMQESKSLGFGASFGGDSGSSLFGSSTADVVKTITAYLACAFFAGCLLLTYWSHALSKTRTVPETSIESIQTSEESAE
jgi:preprotein translocase subunit SecG